MGENFAEIWQSDHCPPTLKKMIFRTAIEEIIVRTDAENKTLQFTIHWKGGAHTQLDDGAAAFCDRDARRPWRHWRSFVGWPFATVTTRLLLC